MAVKIVHGWARTRERVPSGYRKALCGLLVPRRQARTSGVTCTMCQTVKGNTNLSTMALAIGRAHTEQGNQSNRRGGR